MLTNDLGSFSFSTIIQVLHKHSVLGGHLLYVCCRLHTRLDGTMTACDAFVKDVGSQNGCKS